MIAWKISSLQFLKSKVGRGVFFYLFFSPGYNHLKMTQIEIKEFMKEISKKGFQKNINYSAWINLRSVKNCLLNFYFVKGVWAITHITIIYRWVINEKSIISLQCIQWFLFWHHHLLTLNQYIQGNSFIRRHW